MRMNKPYILLIGLSLGVHTLPGQTVEETYNHDAEKQQAFESMINKKIASVGNFGEFTSPLFAKQAYEALAERARVDSLNCIDRMPGELYDVAYKQEAERLNAAADAFQSNINLIRAFGGSIEDKNQWQNIYNSITFALNVIKSSYLPTSKRKVQYQKIIDDYNKQNIALLAYLRNKQSQKLAQDIIEKSNSASLLTTTDKSKVAKDALIRWQNAMQSNNN